MNGKIFSPLPTFPSVMERGENAGDVGARLYAPTKGRRR
jgi:hypothetical protein